MMDVLLLALTVAPGLAIALFIYLKDKFNREPFMQLVLAFFAGFVSVVMTMGLSYMVSMVPGFGDMNTFDNLLRYAYISIALVEEFSKFIVVILLFYHKSFFDEPFDGITYAVMISMGFATLENVMYVFGMSDNGYRTALMRMLTAIPAHASFAVVMGYFIGLARFKGELEPFYLFIGLFGATLLHGTYDFLLLYDSGPYLAIGALGSLVTSLVLSFKAIRIHQHNSPFNPRFLRPEENLPGV